MLYRQPNHIVCLDYNPNTTFYNFRFKVITRLQSMWLWYSVVMVSIVKLACRPLISTLLSAQE